MLNACQFVKECKKYAVLKYDIDGLCASVRNMNASATYLELDGMYETAEYYRHGLFMYFTAINNIDCQSYCARLIISLQRCKIRNKYRIERG